LVKKGAFFESSLFLYRDFNKIIMAIPVANFRFITNGLYAFFEDQSENSPTSWAWDFGDSNTSTEQNPNYEYSTAGAYNVSLVATNTDGSSIAYTIEIIINATSSFTLSQLVAFEMPPSLPNDPSKENYLISKWRLYLHDAFKVAIEYISDETKYTQLQNILIAKLVAYDRIIQLAKDFAASSMGPSSTTGGQSEGGNIKTIKTGPTEAEWYSASDTLKNFFASGPNGNSAMDDLMADICAIANHKDIRVKLPMCRFIKDPITPLKAAAPTYISTEDYMNEYYGTNN
jgi:PKD repeat protein